MNTTLNPVEVAQAAHIEEQWDNFVSGRYKEGKSEAEFRNYDAKVVPTVAEFYKLNHENQTLDFVLSKEAEYFALQKGGKIDLGSGGLPEHAR